jgi:phosphoribosyl-AMP cyclohydrolase
MGTRSRVGVMHGTVCKSVYCHYDGYLDYTGELLNKHYGSVQANQLIARGDNSGVQATVEEMNFYSDRGEDNVSWQVAHTFEEFLEQVESCFAEYYYVMQDGVWYVGAVYDVPGLIKGGLVPLADALAANTIEKLVAEDE